MALPPRVATVASPSATVPTSFTYILQADAFADTQAKAVARLAACDRDWLILDAAYSTESPWRRSDLDTIRRGRPGRRIIAYISIGEAEDYRTYWQAGWTNKGKLTDAAPPWLLPENPRWKGNFPVKYWRPDWQALILPQIDASMARGFDGIYLDIVDGYETFELDGSEWITDRVNPETQQSYRRDMVDWVKIVAARARTTNPQALVVPQNGSQLLEHPDYVSTISAIGIEDLFGIGNKPQPKDDTLEVLGFLHAMALAHKPVLLTEYATKAERRERDRLLANEHGLVLLLTDRNLKTLGESGASGE